MAGIVKALPGMASKLKNTITPVIRSPQMRTLVQELSPPTPREIPQAIGSIVGGVQSLFSQRFLNVTVGRAAQNALTSLEVVCWFFVGEIIGRRSLVGYKVSNI